MKTKIIFFILFCFSINAFSQKQKGIAQYSLCGKECIETITFTLEEFKKCKREFVPLKEGDRIISFVASVQTNGSFISFQEEGTIINEQLSDIIINGKKGQKVLIERVKMMHENKIINIPGVVIIIN